MLHSVLYYEQCAVCLQSLGQRTVSEKMLEIFLRNIFCLKLKFLNEVSTYAAVQLIVYIHSMSVGMAGSQHLIPNFPLRRVSCHCKLLLFLRCGHILKAVNEGIQIQQW